MKEVFEQITLIYKSESQVNDKDDYKVVLYGLDGPLIGLVSLVLNSLKWR